MGSALQRRIERLEGGNGKAPARLKFELQRLQAEVDRDYPGDPMTLPEATVDRYLDESCGAGSDRFNRVAELEQLLATPEQREAERAARAQVANMSAEQLDEILRGEPSRLWACRTVYS